MGSCNPKTVFTAAVVLFNHVLTYKGEIKALTNGLSKALQTILETLSRVTEADSLTALLLAETRIIYKNPDMLAVVMGYKDKFVKVHSDLKAKTQDNNVKQSIEDALSLIGE